MYRYSIHSSFSPSPSTTLPLPSPVVEWREAVGSVGSAAGLRRLPFAGRDVAVHTAIQPLGQATIHNVLDVLYD